LLLIVVVIVLWLLNACNITTWRRNRSNVSVSIQLIPLILLQIRLWLHSLRRLVWLFLHNWLVITLCLIIIHRCWVSFLELRELNLKLRADLLWFYLLLAGVVLWGDTSDIIIIILRQCLRKQILFDLLGV